MKKIFHISITLLLGVFSSHAQTYSLSTGTGTYSALTGATTLASGSTWNKQGYKVPIGFSFGFMGKSFDTLTVAPNGFILFGKDNERAIAAFKGIVPVLDSTNNYSVISYTSSGSILKIEYKNTGFGLYAPDNFNFQVWLHQSGNKIEFHTGTTTLSSVQDSLIMPLTGIINPSMSKTSNGYLITGDPSQPTGHALGAGDLKYLIRVPDANKVYTLTPQ